MKHITDRLYERKWGVFNHFLSSLNETGESWNEKVNNFDVELVARQLKEIGAGYYFITLMQARRFMCAPNSAFDEIAGLKPGEACAKRDLINDLYDALSKYDIDLYLYYTGDGPYTDKEINTKFGFVEPNNDGHDVTERFVNNWAKVLEEYAIRYGDKVKGWWVDGCYDYFGYSNDLLKPYYDAIKKGNPNAIIAFNNGNALRKKDDLNSYYEMTEDNPPIARWYEKEEFSCGELVDYKFIPKGRFIDGEQVHMLVPLGKESWHTKGLCRDPQYLREYCRKVFDKGGVISFEIFEDDTGRFDKEQMDFLKTLNE